VVHNALFCRRDALNNIIACGRRALRSRDLAWIVSVKNCSGVALISVTGQLKEPPRGSPAGRSVPSAAVGDASESNRLLIELCVRRMPVAEEYAMPIHIAVHAGTYYRIHPNPRPIA